MISSGKRKGISSNSESKKTKQKRRAWTNDLLSNYFMEEEFKVKFAKAFRFVKLNLICTRLRELYKLSA